MSTRPSCWWPLPSDARTYDRPVPIEGLDHVAIPSDDPGRLIDFYVALGFAVVGEQAWRAGESPFLAFALGDCKINVHAPALWRNPDFALRGPAAQPGCGDVCLVWNGSVEDAAALIASAGGELIDGPVGRVGGRAGGTTTGTSVYTRDPDGNLVELITYDRA